MPPRPTDAQRISNLASLIAHHYGASFSADCFYDSECLRNASAPVAPSALGGLNSRSWRFQKCSQVAFLQPQPSLPFHGLPCPPDDLPWPSQVAFLQSQPLGGRATPGAAPSLPPLRSSRLTISELQAQCEYLFGRRTVAEQAERNGALNGAFGRDVPASGSAPGSSSIFYMDFRCVRLPPSALRAPSELPLSSL